MMGQTLSTVLVLHLLYFGILASSWDDHHRTKPNKHLLLAKKKLRRAIWFFTMVEGVEAEWDM
jgi:hypothetical protein